MSRATGVVHRCRTGRVSSGCGTKGNGTCNGANIYEGAALWISDNCTLTQNRLPLNLIYGLLCAGAICVLSVIMKGVSTGGPVDTATVQKRQEFAARMGQKTDFGQAPRGYVAGMGAATANNLHARWSLLRRARSPRTVMACIECAWCSSLVLCIIMLTYVWKCTCRTRERLMRS